MTHVYAEANMKEIPFEPSGARKGWSFGMVSIGLLFSGVVGWVILCIDGCGSDRVEPPGHTQFGCRSAALLLLGGPIGLVVLILMGCEADVAESPDELV